jgi:hypothetical protein
MNHPCPGCLRVTSRPGRCVACGGGTTTQRGYGAAWQRRRARQLLRNPTCEWKRGADAHPCGRPAPDVDHVVPKVYGGSDEPDNLQSLCARHHRVKTATQDRRWGTHVERPEDPEDALLMATGGAFHLAIGARPRGGACVHGPLPRRSPL